jgi:hypothetical protein
MIKPLAVAGQDAVVRELAEPVQVIPPTGLVFARPGGNGRHRQRRFIARDSRANRQRSQLGRQATTPPGRGLQRAPYNQRLPLPSVVVKGT